MPFASPTPTHEALRKFADRLDLRDRLAPYAACRWSQPTFPQPVLHLEDVSGIPFLSEIPGVEEYQHRARVRATEDDLYATVTPPDPDYDAYCTDDLALGEPLWIDIGRTDNLLAVTKACMDDVPFELLLTNARRSAGLAIHPYMSIEDVWVLADRLARESCHPVTVVGPPPPVTWIANDKALFDELVTLVLGEGWTTETHPITDRARLTEVLREMAHRHDVVALKRTRCASGMGNLVVEGAPLRTQSPEAIQATVDAFLKRTEWPGDEPVLAVAWENASSSPSTQWWIPPAEHGAPRLDGIYEQILEGDRKLFVGSRPSTLPGAVQEVIRDASEKVAAALQYLGYCGRCSFDHLVIGESKGEFEIRFTECNGRWGGTSTPMHLVDRVVRGPRAPYRAQDFQHDRLLEFGFRELRDRLGPSLFNRNTQTGRYILYNVGPLAAHGKLDVIALGDTQAEAEQALLADFPRLLGL